MKQFKPWMIAAAAATVVVGQASAAPAIQSVTARTTGAEDVIRIQLSEPLSAVPTGFVVQAPARIAIDLPGVDNGLGRSQVDIGQGNVRTANVVQAGDRTRLVLNLRQPTTYKATLEGNALVLVLDSRTSDTPKAEVQPAKAPAATEAPAAAPTHFAEDRATRTQPIRDIDFRRGTDGSGRVLVELPSNQVGVDIRQQGQSLVIEFLRSALPENLRRRFDVSDFGTPIQGMSATQVGDRVRLTVDPRGNWTHSAYQTDNQFVLEVRAQKEDPNKLTKGPGFSGEKLSLNFQNIEVRALLQVIADFTNFNVVTSDTVTGNVTLRLKDVPWDQALDIILQAKGLGVRKNGNVLWIAPRDEIVSRERADLEAKAEVAKIEPLRTQSFQLNYVKAEDIAKSLAGKGAAGNSGGGGNNASRILSPRGSVIFEQRTNQLFVNDTPSKLEEIQNLIAKVDIAVRQVMIEARIVEADERFGRSLGVKLGAMDLRGLRGGTPGVGLGGGSNRALIGGTYQGIGEQTLQAKLTDGSFTPNSYFVNLPAAAVSGANPASVALSLFGADSNRFLNLEISALEADGRGRVVSSPRVITADQVKAIIEQGTELPYLTASSSGATTITFKKANLKLEVTPQITPEGGIILDVDVNKDNPGILTPAGYAIDTKHVQTQVLVENGGTVVIGGIYQQTDRTDVTKVPFIGDVPVLGNLFKSTTKQADKSELLIFLTPKMVSESQALR